MGGDGRTEALVLVAPERLELQPFDVPELADDDALLEPTLVGICGSDWKIFHGKTPHELPLILGHEVVGRLSAVGPAFAQRHRVHEGQLVAVASSAPCWTCQHCQTGRTSLCASKRSYGLNVPCSVPPYLWGGFGRHMYVAPNSIVTGFPDLVPEEAALLTHTVLANGYEWVVEQGGMKPGDRVLVLGAGPQGLGCTIAARESGASSVTITGLSKDAARFELAREFGADATVDVQRDDLASVVAEVTDGELMDLVIDVTGSAEVLADALAHARPGGTVIAAGLKGNGVVAPMLADALVWKGLRVQGVRSSGAQALRAATALQISRRYAVEEMVTHVYGLDGAEKAIRAIGGEFEDLYPTKAAIRPQDGAGAR